eukprot:scaffold7016_cov19-Tisochrysis_lutea.AAC.1
MPGKCWVTHIKKGVTFNCQRRPVIYKPRPESQQLLAEPAGHEQRHRRASPACPSTPTPPGKPSSSLV